MSEFLFLYRSEEGARKPESSEESMQRWVSWIMSIGERGHLKERGLPLETGGKVVGQSVVTDGPYAETKDLVCGFTIVEAKDLEEAVELTKGCPIFDVGGLVEVRPAISMG
jgi:hypothetical protein